MTDSRSKGLIREGHPKLPAALGQGAVLLQAESVTGLEVLDSFDCVLRRTTRLDENQFMLLILNASRTQVRSLQRGLGTFPSFTISLDGVLDGSCRSAFYGEIMPGDLAVHVALLDAVFVHLQLVLWEKLRQRNGLCVGQYRGEVVGRIVLRVIGYSIAFPLVLSGYRHAALREVLSRTLRLGKRFVHRFDEVRRLRVSTKSFVDFDQSGCILEVLLRRLDRLRAGLAIEVFLGLLMDPETLFFGNEPVVLLIEARQGRVAVEHVSLSDQRDVGPCGRSIRIVGLDPIGGLLGTQQVLLNHVEGLFDGVVHDEPLLRLSFHFYQAGRQTLIRRPESIALVGRQIIEFTKAFVRNSNLRSWVRLFVLTPETALL